MAGDYRRPGPGAGHVRETAGDQGLDQQGTVRSRCRGPHQRRGKLHLPGLPGGRRPPGNRRADTVTETFEFSDAQVYLIGTPASTYAEACPGAGKTETIVQRFID